MARHSRPGEDAPAEVLSGLIRVYCEGLEAGARYLTACLTMAAQNRGLAGLPDPVGAATEDLAKIALSDLCAAATVMEPSQHSSQIGLADPDPAATEDHSKIGLTDPG